VDRATAGYLAEAYFEYQAILNGIILTKPVCNLNPYDYIASVEGKLIKCQVKKSYVDKFRQHICSLLRQSGRGTDKRPYKDGDFDFLCVIDLDDSRIYLIPWEVIRDKSSNIMVNGNKYSKYCNNWSFSSP